MGKNSQPLKVAAFQGLWSDHDGQLVGMAIASDQLPGFFYGVNGLEAHLRTYAIDGYTLICQDAERHIINILWPRGADITIHAYEAVFNRASWRYAKGKRAEIWESRNLSAGLSVGAIGRGIKLPLWDKPYVLDNPEDARQRRWKCERHDEWECLPCYAMRQAEIIYRFASSLNDWAVGFDVDMKRTLGGNAVALWHHFDTGKAQNLQGKLVVEMARAAYHGGRCEVYQVGNLTDIYTYDVSRHYAAVMRDEPMPDLHGLTYIESPKPLDLSELLGVIEADVYIPNMAVPVLPVTGSDDQLYFPVGRVRGTWVIAELVAALNRGAIIQRIHRIAYTRRRVYPFETFVNVVLNLRAEWERDFNPLAFWAKMLPNGLYGRLGVREIQAYRTYHRSQRPLTPKDIDGKDVIWIGDMRFVISDYNIRMKSKIQNVLWAAHITAYGRLRLLRHLENAGPFLAYCDTDSVFSTAPLVVEPPGAGSLRDTGHFQRGTIVGPKLYRLENGDTPDMVVARGIPKQLALEFLNMGKVEVPQPYSLHVAVDQLRRPGQWATAIRNHRNVALKRQPIEPAVPGAIGYHSFTRPVVFGPDTSGLLTGRDLTTTSR